MSACAQAQRSVMRPTGNVPCNAANRRQLPPGLQQRHARCMVARPQASGKGGDSGSSSSSSSRPQKDAGHPPQGASQPVAAELSDVTSLEFPAQAFQQSSGPEAHTPTAVRTSGLHSTPMGTGVQNATVRCDLPSPAVAVRNLVEQAQFAHLCTIMSGMHHRRAGYPFGTLVDVAADGAGHPIFSLSPLAIHTRNIQEDPRCSLVVQLPGYTGLANARVTIFGDVYQLPKELQGEARDIFAAKICGTNGISGDNSPGWVSGNAMFFRMNRIIDILFVGGFGTVQWVNPDEYTTAEPDLIVVNNSRATLRALNETHAGGLRDLLSRPELPAEDAAFISIDRLGTDVRVRRGGEYTVVRIGFDVPVHTLEDAHAVMQRLLRDPNKLKIEV